MTLRLRDLCRLHRDLEDKRRIATATRARPDIRCAAALAWEYDAALKVYAFQLNIDPGMAKAMHLIAEGESMPRVTQLIAQKAQRETWTTVETYTPDGFTSFYLQFNGLCKWRIIRSAPPKETLYSSRAKALNAFNKLNNFSLL